MQQPDIHTQPQLAAASVGYISAIGGFALAVAISLLPNFAPMLLDTPTALYVRGVNGFVDSTYVARDAYVAIANELQPRLFTAADTSARVYEFVFSNAANAFVAGVDKAGNVQQSFYSVAGVALVQTTQNMSDAIDRSTKTILMLAGLPVVSSIPEEATVVEAKSQSESKSGLAITLTEQYVPAPTGAFAVQPTTQGLDFLPYLPDALVDTTLRYESAVSDVFYSTAESYVAAVDSFGGLFDTLGAAVAKSADMSASVFAGARQWQGAMNNNVGEHLAIAQVAMPAAVSNVSASAAPVTPTTVSTVVSHAKTTQQPVAPAPTMVARATSTALASANYVTQQSLQTQLEALSNKFSSLVYSQTQTTASGVPQYVAAGGVNFGGDSTANGVTRIDTLNNVTITNATVSGSSIVATSLASTLGVGGGGTGTSTAPVYGQVLVGNTRGTYDLVATSSLGFISSGGGSVGNWFSPSTFGSSPVNATSTLVGFTQGLFSLASSTIGNGTQTGGLTISGGATTTGTAYFAGNVGIGTSTSLLSALSVGGQLAFGQTATSSLALVGSVLWNGSSLYGKLGTATTSVDGWFDLAADHTIDVFLIAGQSNAVGASPDIQNAPTPISGTVYKYRQGIISAGTDPVGNTNNGSAWPQFGITYNGLTGHKVLLVDAAYGGTGQIASSSGNVANWYPTQTAPYGNATSYLYASSTAMLTAAETAARAIGFSPRFVGILWVQGENDAGIIDGGNETKADYKTGLEAMITQYHTDLGSTTPFYIFRTGMAGDGSNANGFRQVRDAQEEAAQELSYTYLVFRNAVDFPSRGLQQSPGVTLYHYMQAGYNEMGRIGAEGVVNHISAPYLHPQSNNLLFDLSSSTAHLLVGVGTTTPSSSAYALEIIGDVSNYNRQAAQAITQYGGPSALYLKRSNGTVNVNMNGVNDFTGPLALNANEAIGGIYGIGYGNDGFNATSSGIVFNSAESYNVNNHGSYITFLTTPAASNAASITLDAATSTIASSTTSALTFSHTVDSGSNKLLVCSVTYASQNGLATSVTYGGVALTQKVRAAGSTSSAELWYLLAPTPGTANVVVTFATATGAAVGCQSFSNVDQMSTFGTATTTTGSATQTGTLPTNTASGYWVIDVLGKRAGNESATASYSSMVGLQATSTAATGGAEQLRTSYTIATSTITYTAWSWPTTARGFAYLAIPIIPTQSPAATITERARLTSTGSLGIGTATPYARLSVWGSDTASSTLAFNVVNSASTTLFAVFDGGNAQLSGTLTQSSDQRLKTNIQSLEGTSSLALISQLNPVTFNWIDHALGTTPQLGFIAQQVQPIFPELVSTTTATVLTPDGTLGVNYIGFIAPIIKAIQEILHTIEGFAESFTTKKLCLTDNAGTTCVTKQQLDALLQMAGQQSAASAGTPSANNSADDLTATSTTAVDTDSTDGEATTTPVDATSTSSS